MSQHAIEDLIEDTTRLIDAADWSGTTKRDYLDGIYRVHALYDTGYTHFRVIDILLKYKFVYRVPADSYPGYSQKAEDIPGWMQDNDTGELAYVQQEDGQPVLYIDAGSVSWRKLCKAGILKDADCAAITVIPLARLINQVLQETEKQGQTSLLNQWYGLLVNGYLDGTLDEKEGFPASFSKLTEDETMLSIRAIAQRNKVKRVRDADESILLPVLSEEVSLSGGLEKEYIARFLLDLKKSPDALTTAYAKASKAKLASHGLIEELINGQLNAALSSRQWIQAPEDKKNAWHWYRDEALGRRFLWIVFEENDKFLMGSFGMQHHLLLKWQQRDADTQLPHVHFFQMASSFLPESRREDKKFIHPWGGWKFDLSKSKKTLQVQIDHLIEDLALAEASYFDYLDKAFPEAFFKHDPKRLLHLLEEGEDGTGIIPDYVLFDSPYAILLSFVYHYKAHKKDNEAAAMVKTVKEKLHGKERKSAYETKYLEPFLLQYEKDQDKAAMPLVYHPLLVKALLKGN